MFWSSLVYINTYVFNTMNVLGNNNVTHSTIWKTEGMVDYLNSEEWLVTSIAILCQHGRTVLWPYDINITKWVSVTRIFDITNLISSRIWKIRFPKLPSWETALNFCNRQGEYQNISYHFWSLDYFLTGWTDEDWLCRLLHVEGISQWWTLSSGIPQINHSYGILHSPDKEFCAVKSWIGDRYYVTQIIWLVWPRLLRLLQNKNIWKRGDFSSRMG